MTWELGSQAMLWKWNGMRYIFIFSFNYSYLFPLYNFWIVLLKEDIWTAHLETDENDFEYKYALSDESFNLIWERTQNRKCFYEAPSGKQSMKFILLILVFNKEIFQKMWSGKKQSESNQANARRFFFFMIIFKFRLKKMGI